MLFNTIGIILVCSKKDRILFNTQGIGLKLLFDVVAMRF
jgi:hypothetical protein